MQFDDIDPHRRNLVVTCLGFLLFFIGGGQMAEKDHLQLSFVNIEFTRPEAILVMAVLMLIWFTFRYIQKGPRFSYIFNEDLIENIKTSFYNHESKIREGSNNSFLCANPNVWYRFWGLRKRLESVQVVRMKLPDEHDQAGYERVLTQGSAPMTTDEFSRQELRRIANAARFRTLFVSHAFLDWLFPLGLAGAVYMVLFAHWGLRLWSAFVPF